MRQIALGSDQFLENAQRLTKELTRTHWNGSVPNSMRKLEQLYGIDYWWTHRLRYEFARLSDIPVAVYARIEAAYQAECDRQERLNEKRREVADSISAATRILDEADFNIRCAEASETTAPKNG